MQTLEGIPSDVAAPNRDWTSEYASPGSRKFQSCSPHANTAVSLPIAHLKVTCKHTSVIDAIDSNQQFLVLCGCFIFIKN